jgi:hypothetical protein
VVSFDSVEPNNGVTKRVGFQRLLPAVLNKNWMALIGQDINNTLHLHASLQARIKKTVAYLLF